MTAPRNIHDDRTLEDRCLGVLQDFSDREGKRLVLVVENLNMMFRDMGDDDAGWQLRKTLQTEPRIVLLASATSRFDQMNDPKEALYELFRVTQLHPLDTEGGRDRCMERRCAPVRGPWQISRRVSGRRGCAI